MRVVLDEEALDDLRGIFANIAKDNPVAAAAMINRIFDQLDRLGAPELKEMGRPGLDPGTRELIEYPYIIVYEVHEAIHRIVVLSVVHGAHNRKWSPPQPR